MANDRVYQLPVEVVLLPTDSKARMSQEVVEAVLSPTDGKARVSQFCLEAIISLSPPTTIAQVGLVG